MGFSMGLGGSFFGTGYYSVSGIVLRMCCYNRMMVWVGSFSGVSFTDCPMGFGAALLWPGFVLLSTCFVQTFLFFSLLFFG